MSLADRGVLTLSVAFTLLTSVSLNAGEERSPAPRADAYGDPLPAGAEVRLGTLRGRQPGAFGRVTFSPDGKLLASWGHGGTVQVMDVASGKTLLQAERLGDEVLAVRFRGQELDLFARYPRLWRYDLATGVRVEAFTYREDWDTTAADFAPDGKTLVVGFSDGRWQLRDAGTGKALRDLPGPKDYPKGVRFAPGGRFLARAGRGSVSLVDLTTGKESRLREPPGQEVAAVAFSPDGVTLAAATYYEGVVRLWDVTRGGEGRVLPGKEFGTRAVAFAPDGKTLAHGGEAGIIHLKDPGTGKEVGRISAGYNLFSLAFSPDGKTVAASMALFYQRKTRLWDVATGRELHVLPRHEQRIDTLLFPGDGSRVITASVDQTVRVWDGATGKHLFCIGENRPTDERLTAPPCAAPPDGKFLLTAREDVTHVWDVASGKEVRRFTGPEGKVLALAVSPDGKTFASVSWEREPAPVSSDVLIYYMAIHLRNLVSGKVLLTIPRVKGHARSLSYSPDGKLLAAAALEGGRHLALYDTTSGKELRALDWRGDAAHAHQVFQSAFAPGGDLLAVAADSGRVYVWEVATGKLVRTLWRPEWAFRAFAFSPDGRKLLAAGENGLCLFTTADGTVLGEKPGIPFRVVTFSPDGERVATGSEDGTGLIWQLKAFLVKP